MDPGDFPHSNPTNTIPPVSAYYELSWSILSTIGIANFLFGLIVVAITSLTPVIVVPIVCSIACAISNGLCYYAYYTYAPLLNRGVASVFADVFWLVQEAGLSFYSYVILRRVLYDRQRLVFLNAFWFCITVLVAVRVTIMVLRLRSILEAETNFQHAVRSLHITYFVLIATLECLSAFFLLRKFATARSTSIKAALRTGLIQYLLRSTEVRVALLCLTGITRAVTYSFQGTAQSATTTASQIDRLAYTLESMFPIILYIDILASKLQFSVQSSGGSLPSSMIQRHYGQFSSPRSDPHSSASGNSGCLTSVHNKPRNRTDTVQAHSGQRQSHHGMLEQGEPSIINTGDISLQEQGFEENNGSNKNTEP